MPAYSVQTVKNRQKSKFFCNAQSPYQTASENYRNKQGTVSLIITDPSTCEIKPNMFSSLLIMEMDYLTERTITGWCNTKFVLNILLNLASLQFYLLPFIWLDVQISSLNKRGSKKADKPESASFNLSLFHTP